MRGGVEEVVVMEGGIEEVVVVVEGGCVVMYCGGERVQKMYFQTSSLAPLRYMSELPPHAALFVVSAVTNCPCPYSFFKLQL